MRFSIIFLVMCVIRTSIQRMETHEEKTMSAKETSCVSRVLTEYLKHNRNALIFSTEPINPWNILLKVPNMFFNEWDSFHTVLSTDTGAVIIFMEGNVDRDMKHLSRMKGLVMVHPILMVCVNDPICSSKEYLRKIAKWVKSAKLHYVAVNDEGTIDIYKWTTTAEKNCGMAQLLYQGSCSNKSFVKKMFRTPLNFHKCRLKLVTWLRPPYSDFCSPQSSNKLCGIEGHMLRIIAAKFNATPTLMFVETPRDVRSIVMKGFVHLGYGNLDSRFFDGVSVSNTYNHVVITIVAPESLWMSNRQWDKFYMLMTYRKEVWLGIGLVIVVIFILGILVLQFRRIGVLLLFRTSLGKFMSPSLSSRLYFLSLMFFSSFIAELYLANQMAHVFSDPVNHASKTLGYIENSDIIVSGARDDKRVYKDEYPRIYSNFKVDDYMVLQKNIAAVLAGEIVLALHVEDSAATIAGWKNVEALDNAIQWQTQVLIAPNSSIILKATNKVLSSIRDTGLVQGISSRVNLEHYDKFFGFNPNQESKKLTLNKTLSTFLLLIAGLTISFFVFLIELATEFLKTRYRAKLESSQTHRESQKRSLITFT